MILLVGLVAGVAVGWGLAASRRLKYEAPVLLRLWLAPAAYLLQLIERSADIPLILSQMLFIAFAFVNRKHTGMKILLVGALLNFAVMSANGGFMPISFETAAQLVPPNALEDAQPGTRFSVKDILLPPEQTRFEWLADRFLPPGWFSYQFAFSLGDVFIACGVFWLLAWRPSPTAAHETRHSFEDKRLTL